MSASRKPNSKPPPPGRPRRKDCEQYQIDPVMPPTPSLGYLLEYLFEFGPTSGEQPIGGLELEAWERLLGIEWHPWESRLMHKLSKAYISEMHAATKRDAPPPWAIFEKPWRWIQQQKAERRLDGFLR